jgi:hypothetical protein
MNERSLSFVIFYLNFQNQLQLKLHIIPSFYVKEEKRRRNKKNIEIITNLYKR